MGFEIKHLSDVEFYEDSKYLTFSPIRPHFDPQKSKKPPKSAKIRFYARKNSWEKWGFVIYTYLM